MGGGAGLTSAHEAAVDEKKISALQAAFTVIKCNWGIGLMSIPYMLDQAGTVTGIVLFVLSIGLTQASISKLIAVKGALEDRARLAAAAQWGTVQEGGGADDPVSGWAGRDDEAATAPLLVSQARRMTRLQRTVFDYSAIMGECLGAAGQLVAILGIWLSSYGSCVAYLKFIGDNLTRFFPGESAPSELEWVAIAGVPCLLLAVADRVGFLWPFNGFGLLCGVAFGCLVIYDTAISVSWHDFVQFWRDEPYIRPGNLPLALSIAAFCNEGIVALSPSTQSSMRKPSQFLTVAMLSLLFFTVCYMAIGVAANILYAGDVKQDISLNFSGSIPEKVAVVLYCAQLIPTFGVVYFVAYEAAESSFMFRFLGVTNRPEYLATHRGAKALLVVARWGLVVLSGVLALLVPRFGDYLGLIGALANSALIYVMPHLCWLRVCAPLEGHKGALFYGSAAFSVLNILAGVALAVYGTYQAVEGLMG